MHRLSFWFLLLSAWLLAVPAPAQESRVAIDARFVPAKAKPGDEVVLEVACEIETGYHIYGKKDPGEATRLEVVDGAGLEALGGIDFPDGVQHTAYGQTNFWVEGKATLKQRFKVPATASGTLRPSFLLKYLACTPEFCDPPAKDAFNAKLDIEGGAAKPAPAVAPARAPVAGSGQDPTRQPGIGIGALEDEARMTVTARFVPDVARPGDEVVLELQCEIADGYHVYGRKDAHPTTLKVLDAADLQSKGAFEFPDGEPHEVIPGETNYWVLRKPVARQRFVVPADATNGDHAVRGHVDYQPCTVSMCENEAKATFRATLRVEGGRAPADGAAGNGNNVASGGGSDAGADGTARPKVSLDGVVLRQPKFNEDGGDDLGSLWSLILLCIGGGLFALAMPCTYPMIPITFSFFTKQADARGGNVLPLALAYGLGIVLIFVVIGVAVGGVITVFAAHWLTNLVIGGAFVVFALTLFGWIVLQPPQFMNRIAGSAGRSGGLVGVFLMGATLVVTSFTCTAPIVGSLLTSVATAGTARVALGMGVFGLTMAAPFVLLALLPGRVKKLPKSGEWMNTLKVSLGFVELAAALKFISNVDIVLAWGILPREVFLGAWAFLFALLALYLFGAFSPRGEPVVGVSTARNGCGIASLLFAIFCGAGMSGLPLGFVMTAFEPNYQLRPVQEHEIVTDDHLAALELARREHKYVLVNFTGFT